MKNKAAVTAVFLLVLLPAAVSAGLYVGATVFAAQAHLKTAPHIGMLPHYWQAGKIPPNLKMPLATGTLAATLFGLGMPLFVLALLLGKKRRELHGSMRFAGTAEIKRAGLLKSDKAYGQEAPDLIVGKYKGRYLRWSGDEYMYLAARTRSGKGVGIVIPNCLHYRDSLVVYDPKLENFLITAGFRAQHGQEVFLFNPGGRMPEHEGNPGAPLQSHRWNPFTYVRRDPRYTYKDLSAMAAIMLPVSARDSGNSTFFTESGRKLFVGLGLYMIETENERDLDDYRQRSSMTNLFKLTAPKDGRALTEWITDEIKLRSQTPGRGLSEQCKTLLAGFAGGNAKTGADIVATLTAPLGIFLDPVVEAATSGDDFRLDDLRKKRMTVYIGILSTESAVFSRLTNLLFSQIAEVNVLQGLPEHNPQTFKYKCLLLMDEFTALGSIPAIRDGVSYLAGYGLRIVIVIQAPSQVEAVYGRENMNTFFSNFTLRIFFTPREQADAEEYSRVIGYETFKSKSVSRSRGKGGTSRSQNTGDQKRAVMNPDEIKRMPLDKCVIDMAGYLPVYADKIVYWRDPVFQSRAKLTPPEIPPLDIAPAARKSAENPVAQYVPDERLPDKKASACTNEEEVLTTLLKSFAAQIGRYPENSAEVFACAQKSFGAFGVRLLAQMLSDNQAA